MCFSGAGWILKEPLVDGNGSLLKGALILTKVDEFCELVPEVLDYFFIVERKGWHGPVISTRAHIKLVDDRSCWEQTKALSPQAILLDLSPPDFVNTDLFFPLGFQKDYTGIQIASWNTFKRHELFVQGAAILKGCQFIHFGHFLDYRDTREIALSKGIKRLAKRTGADIWFPFSENYVNSIFDYSSPEVVNAVINRCQMGILTTKAEGVNRFKMECMAADLPVLVASDVSFPTRKHINEQTGYFFDPTPEGLALGVRYVQEHYAQFSPRKYVLENTGYKKSLSRLADALNTLSKKEGHARNFNDIYWDGRNKMLLWDDLIVTAVRQSIHRVRSREHKTGLTRKDKKEFSVSVLIRTRNQQERLRVCLEAILKLNYTSYNIVVVNDNSIDGTTEYLNTHFSKDSRFILVHNKRHLTTASLYNLGIKHAKGEIIALTRDDCEVDKDWLKELTKPFLFDEVMSVGGQFHKQGKNGPCGRAEWMAGCNMAVRSTVFSRFCFDPNLKYSHYYDEYELVERLKAKGLLVSYAPGAVVTHFETFPGGKEPGDSLLRRELDYIYLRAKHRRILRYFYRVSFDLDRIVCDLMKMGRHSPGHGKLKIAGEFMKIVYVLLFGIPLKAFFRKIYDDLKFHFGPLCRLPLDKITNYK